MDAYNLLDESYTTVAVRFFNPDEVSHARSQKQYHYKIPRDWVVKEGTLLVVEASSTFRIVEVVTRHDEPQFNGLPKLKWVVQVIDLTAYIELNTREQMFRDALQAVARQRERDALITTLTTTASGSPAAKALLGEALSAIGVEVPTLASAAPPTPGHLREPFSPEGTTAGWPGDGPAHADDGHAGFTPPEL